MNAIVERAEVSEVTTVTLTDNSSFEVEFNVPANPRAVAVIAPGMGSSRLSPRNRYLAGLLRVHGLATVLIDYQTYTSASARAGEECSTVYSIAERIHCASEWLRSVPGLAMLPQGFIGSGTGGAAALLAASYSNAAVRAVVSRSGRLALVNNELRMVHVPTLLIVGARDLEVVYHNREAIVSLPARHKRLEVIPGAHHLFEEPGTLAAVAHHSACWLGKHLCSGETAPLDSYATTAVAYKASLSV